MVEPIEHIVRQAFGVERRVRTEGQRARLRGKADPGLFETIARFAQPQSPRVRLEQLQPPTESRSEAQRSLMIEPAVVKIGSGHSGRNAQQTLRFASGR